MTHLARRLVRASYEREMELLPVLCDRERTGIDVGAKVGMYTYRIRDRSSDVVAFEPIPLFNQMLKKVFDGRRGRIEPFAVSDKRGTAVLRMPFDQSDTPQFGRSTIDTSNPLDHKLCARTEELEVETRRIDDYEFQNVGFIKIDVEGHELAVLDGAEKTISDQHPNLLIECNDDHNPSGVSKLITWLHARDYTTWFLAKGELLDASRYDRDEHWTRQHIENFIGVHSSRAAVCDSLRERVATMPWRSPAI